MTECEKTNKLLSYYKDGKTCGVCIYNKSGECTLFEIDVANDFSCLEVKEATDGK